MKLKNSFTVIFVFLLFFVVISCGDSEKKSEENKEQVAGDTTHSTVFMDPTGLRDTIEVHTGDFDMMLERRIIRVLVPYSRTLFFLDKGRERGITAELVREFERFLNTKYRRKLKKRPITVVILPAKRDQLFPLVKLGIGDIAAGNLTATKERLQKVDFMAPPEQPSVSELILTRKQDAPINNVEELSGQTVYVRKSSSYYQSLQKLDKILVQKGKEQIDIVTVSEALEDEDLMEMLDAGIISTIVVDDWKAKMWAKILPNIKVNEHVAVRTGGHIGWAYRKNSPLLLAELKEFYYKYEKRIGTIPYRFEKYNRQVKRLQNPTGSNSWKRHLATIKLFDKYGKKYGFDPLMLTAQGYQESKLNQSKRSRVGAIGVMQLMPKTGAAMKVGDVTKLEPNIHAGTKYMDRILKYYFQDADFDNFNKNIFAFASYNAGPNRIARLRKLAADRGLNPDVWLDNVEIIVSEKVGRETTSYVRNIVKYYYSYKLISEIRNEKSKARKSFN